MDNPEEIEKIEVEEQIEAKIADLLPEDAENNEKLKQMDALVASYIAECNAEIEKNAKNTEKNAQNWENTGTNGKIREIMGIYGNNWEIMETRRNKKGKKVPLQKMPILCIVGASTGK